MGVLSEVRGVCARARSQHIRVGRGDSARRGNYAGRGMKGKKARECRPWVRDGRLLSVRRDAASTRPAGQWRMRKRRPPWGLRRGVSAGGRSHILYDGGQLGLIKFPVTRERPP